MPTLRNHNDRARLIERIRSLSGDESPAWGMMNVNQMVSHLVQAGELPFSVSLPDRSNFFSRTFIKPLILYVMPMPREVKTSPEFNQQENGRKPLAFDLDKGLVIDSINKIGDLATDQDCKHHPMFGKMSSERMGSHCTQAHRPPFKTIWGLSVLLNLWFRLAKQPRQPPL